MMEKFIQFMISHWLWLLALIVVLVLLLYEELKDRFHGIARLTPQQLTQLHNNDEAVAVDVRDRKAYDQGHIIEAVSLPLTELDSGINKLEKHKNKTLVVVDETGQNSVKIALKLQSQGFKTAVLSGGIDAWINAGLPLSRK